MREDSKKFEKEKLQLASKLRIFSETKDVDIGFDEPLSLKILVNPASERNKITSVTLADPEVIKKTKRRLGF